MQNIRYFYKGFYNCVPTKNVCTGRGRPHNTICYTFLNSINSQVVRIKIKISETIRARFTKKNEKNV